MEARLTTLNKQEILKYLGYGGQGLTPELSAQIERCAKEVMAAAAPRLVYREVPVRDGMPEGLTFGGKDIPTVLANCHTAVLMAVTVGPGIDRLIRRREVTDPGDALIMDACGSTAAENVCNNFEADLRQEVEKRGEYLTDRYSPGYGDIPLGDQVVLCGALDIGRRIGVTLGSNLLMTPAKSVTAVLGISREPVARREPECEHCPSFMNCTIRRGGRTCRDIEL